MTLSYLGEHSEVSQARSLHACWTRILYNDRLEAIDNSQSTNSAKTLRIFNVYSKLTNRSWKINGSQYLQENSPSKEKTFKVQNLKNFPENSRETVSVSTICDEYCSRDDSIFPTSCPWVFDDVLIIMNLSQQQLWFVLTLATRVTNINLFFS